MSCALVLALALTRPRRQSETDAILSRYGSLIVGVERVWQQPGVAVIDVADFDALARVAGHYERSILHERAEYGDAFWVSDESGQFRYAVLDPAWERLATEPQAPQAGAWAQPEPDVALGDVPVDPVDVAEAGYERPEGEPEPLSPAGWAPAAGAPAAEPIAAEDLRETLPAETLRFGAVSPSPLAHASRAWGSAGEPTRRGRPATRT